MGGGVAMRAAAKVAGLGFLNRGGENPLVRPSVVASVVSSASDHKSGDDVKLAIENNNKTNSSSSVEKPYPYPYNNDDWEFAADEDEPHMMIPRVVFGGAPTIQEAKQATSDLNDALDKTYLSSNGQQPLQPCLVTETCLVSTHAIQAFRLLHENAEAQNVVASIASDQNVWNAVLKNEALVDFFQTHKTSVEVNEEEKSDESKSDASGGKGFMDYVEDIKQKITVTAGAQVNEEEKSDESKSDASGGKGVFMDYVEDIKQKITVTVVDMMTSLSDTFQSLFGGSAKDEYAMNPDGTTVEKATIGATLMGLAIMVIMVVVLKRV